MRIAFSIILLVFSLPCFTSGQIPGLRQGSQLPFLSLNAHSASLGDADVGLLGRAGYPANPAALGFPEGSSIQYTFHNIADGYSLQRLAVVLHSSEVDGWGAQVDLLHFGDLRFYGDSGLRKEGFELAGGVSYGRRIFHDFGLGMTLQILIATTDTQTVRAVVGDFGFSYTAGKYYKFGLSLRGLGTDYEVRKPVVTTTVYSPTLTRSVSFGVVFDYPFARYSQRILLAFENDKLLGQSGILYKLGVEYVPVSVLAIRGGAVIRQHEVQPRAGFGVTAGNIKIDYAYLYSRQEGHPSHLATFMVSCQ